MPTLSIEGQKVEVEKGTLVLEAAKRLGIDIPHFCYHPKLPVAANCRMCLVEIAMPDREGNVRPGPKPQPACQVPAADGMEVTVASGKLDALRKGILELILLNHPVDCPICDKAGECALQDQYYKYSKESSRLADAKVRKPKRERFGPHILYDAERCISCSRCVRFLREKTKTGELDFVWRGNRKYITTFPGRELDNAYSINVTDLCPVGALTDVNFRFRCRVWFMKQTPSVCVGCSRGCNVNLEGRLENIHRAMPRDNDEINECWLCDEGRLAHELVNKDRLLAPSVPGKDARKQVSWDEGLKKAVKLLEQARSDEDGDGPAAILSPLQPTEANQAVVRLFKDLLGCTRFAMGGRPDGEGDEWLRRADKNPNRAGALGALGDLEPIELEELLSQAKDGKVPALFVLGGELPLDDGELESLLEQLDGKTELIVASSNLTRLSEAAGVALPLATFAEGYGHFTNCDGVVQSLRPALDPRGEAWTGWQIAGEVAQRMGFDEANHGADAAAGQGG